MGVESLPMKNTTTPAVVFTFPTPATVVSSGFTRSLDLGDRHRHACVLDAAPECVPDGGR